MVSAGDNFLLCRNSRCLAPQAVSAPRVWRSFRSTLSSLSWSHLQQVRLAGSSVLHCACRATAGSWPCRQRTSSNLTHSDTEARAEPMLQVLCMHGKSMNYCFWTAFKHAHQQVQQGTYFWPVPIKAAAHHGSNVVQSVTSTLSQCQHWPAILITFRAHLCSIQCWTAEPE